MRTVWKFPIEISNQSRIRVPCDAPRVLLAGCDPSSVPCLWIDVDPQAEQIECVVNVRGTGHPMPPDPCHHLGSFVDDQFVWHVYSPSLTR